MSETGPADGWSDGGGWGTEGSQSDDAADSEPGTGDNDAANPEDAGDGPDAGTGDDIVDAEIVGADGEPVPNDGGAGYAAGREVEPRPMSSWEYGHRPVSHEGNQVVPHKVGDDPGAWGWGAPAPAEPSTPASPRQGPNDGARPGGGSQGGMKGDGVGGGAGTGKRKITRGEKRAGFKGGGSGGGGGVHVSIFGGILTGASVVKTGAIGSGNAIVKGRTGSGNTGINAGPVARAAAKKRRNP